MFEQADADGDDEFWQGGAETDSTAMISFARTDSGMVPVGLNAQELVIETER